MFKEQKENHFSVKEKYDGNFSSKKISLKR